jgi:GT2 family glycosyltransferase
VEEVIEENLEREFAFDQYGRYAIIRNIIDANRSTNETFKILDVGGRGNIMKKFLPEDEVFYLDPLVDSEDTNFILGDGCSMPFDDESFDWVTSADVYEHILYHKRMSFLTENIRAAKLGVILTAPFYSKEVEKAEIYANESYKILSGGEDHIWLKEHLAFDLPKEEEIESFLSSNSIQFSKFFNNNLSIWEHLIGICFLVSQNYSDEIKKAFEVFNYFYNTWVFPFDSSEPAYRKIYFIKKRKTLINPLFGNKTIDEDLILLTIKKGTDLVNLINRSNRILILSKENKINYLDIIIREKENQLQEKENQLQENQKQLVALYNSLSWKLTTPFRKLFSFGFKLFLSPSLSNQLSNDYDLNHQYNIWRNQNFPSDETLTNQKMIQRKFIYRPKISIIVTIDNPTLMFLIKSIESIIQQTYDNWELCLAVNYSTQLVIKKRIQFYLETDKRIKIIYYNKNSQVIQAANSAVQITTGEFIASLGQNDEIAPHALYKAIELLNEKNDADLIYFDEDKIESDGTHVDPHFKPDWSPDTFLSYCYLGHFTIFRKNLIDAIQGLQADINVSMDYDLLLRITEKTNKIYHIADILYSERKFSSLITDGQPTKTFNHLPAIKSLMDALDRRGIEAQVLNGICDQTFRIKYKINDMPLVSIIIPSKDKADYLENCLNSILYKTSYSNYEIQIIDTGSILQDTFSLYQSLKEREHITISFWKENFNYSRVNNFGALQARGEFLLFLNNDTEVITSDWIEAMLEHAQRSEVGAVGVKLLYPDNKIQHAGVILGMGGVAGHVSRNFPDDDFQSYPVLYGKDIVRNFTSVTGACLMIAKNKFFEVDGFDPKFRIAFNDIDFCLKLYLKKYFNLYTPFAKLYHHESISVGKPGEDHRDLDEFSSEIQMMHDKWCALLKKDPYYNKNLSLINSNISIKVTSDA